MSAMFVDAAEVHGVITFYHDFRDSPCGRHLLKICRAESCQAVGAETLIAHAKQQLGIEFHETSNDGRITLEPGWRWSECIKPIAGTESCQLSHVGHLISGQIGVRLNDGSEQTIKASHSYTIPPGHDAWVIGNEPAVGIEVMSADQFGRPQA